ncbi:MAG: hypothetical protein DVB26_06275 [Verrucomicrobia bacterium]|nr:MAG: hypothetical protein DVB26_06275 [Verrucomicrobiota bacterium]
MSNPPANADEPLMREPPEFSLVLGGPLYQLWRRTHLSGDALEMLRRRVVVLAMLAWVPLLMLSVAEGHAWAGKVKLPFLHDIEMHMRLLLALPLLIVAELVVHQRMRTVVSQFIERGLITDATQTRFYAAIAAALRLRNSVTAEVVMIALVYGLGVLFVWRTQVALNVTCWYGMDGGGKLHPSLAGWWMGCVSLPVFQFLLLRWYFRLFIWARFLWQLSRLQLNFMPTHPDRCGGLSFLASVSHAFTPVLVAQGALLAGVMANKIFVAQAKLVAFKIDIIGLVAVMIFAILGPLLVFLPQHAAAKRKGLREYGRLAQQYAREFDHKWLRAGAAADEPLMGSSDIQSLADLGNSYAVVKEMRLLPFTMPTVLQLAITTLLPVAPLLLTMIPLEELLVRMLKIIF